MQSNDNGGVQDHLADSGSNDEDYYQYCDEFTPDMPVQKLAKFKSNNQKQRQLLINRPGNNSASIRSPVKKLNI